MTSEIQLIDDGLGYAVKHKMGHSLDKWFEEDEVLAAWTGEGADDLPMWQKRVLITQLASEAWETVCSRFNFEAAATRIGMRMTVDGSDDDEFGCKVATNSFSDVYVGEQNTTDDQGTDPEEQARLDEAIDADCSDRIEDGEETEAEDDYGSQDSNSKDDTALVLDTVRGAPKVSPSGFVYAKEMPLFGTREDQQNFVGSYILHAFDLNSARGLFIGKVTQLGVSTL